GPEASFEIKELMENNPFIDYVIFGEGEETFKEFLEEIQKTNPNLHKIRGLAYKENNDVIINEGREPIDNLDI
ncbi:MAG TPA: B12-binding domain-containing radical SAM protein, partial [Clostridiales bacterium]|nr:B12-binding domain-containing radical SAM protein [Clostridiales bacterium]